MVFRSVRSWHSTNAMAPFLGLKEVDVGSLSSSTLLLAEMVAETLAVASVENSGDFGLDLWDEPEVIMYVACRAPLGTLNGCFIRRIRLCVAHDPLRVVEVGGSGVFRITTIVFVFLCL